MQDELQLHQERVKALQGAIDLLERLGSNNALAEQVLQSKEYAPKAFCVEAVEVLGAIRELKMMLSDEAGEVEAILYQRGYIESNTGKD